MTGYMLAMGPCFGCGRVFSFNPHRVPSIKHPDDRAERRPICRTCIERINPLRKKNGLAEIVPLPDAYEATEE